MATDQGKNSNITALAVLADATGRGIPETGTTTFRPPYVPVAMAALGAGGQGKGFAPERFLTSDRATRALRAPMIEAGLWYRPIPQPSLNHRRPQRPSRPIAGQKSLWCKAFALPTRAKSRHRYGHIGWTECCSARFRNTASGSICQNRKCCYI